ncbi:MAG TPA: hypothetical protein VE907_07390 [Gammaproteobacteria bacterium]|nr:hypothetical protein [Gammaproteobacteria bacterium]
MLNNIKDLAVFVLIVVVGIGVYQYFNSWGDLQKRLDAANTARDNVERTAARLQDTNTRLDEEKQGLSKQLTTVAVQIEQRDTRIAALETNLKSLNFGNLANTSMQATANEFIRAFELPSANISVRDFPMLDPQTFEVRTSSAGTPITQPFLVLPVPYIKLAIEARNTVITREQQLALTNQIRGLQDERDELNKKIIALEEDRNKAVMEAYNEAYATFETIHKNYVELLNSPPKVDVAPKWLQLLGGVALGAILCTG